MATEKDTLIVTDAKAVEGSASAKSARNWKTALCSCFQYGFCHPPLWCACFTPTILMGQLLTRMKMTWFGSPSVAGEYKDTFKIVLVIAIVNYIIFKVFNCSEYIPGESEDGVTVLVKNEHCNTSLSGVAGTINSVCALYTFILMVRLRMAIRAKYSISESTCVGCEDCCLVFWCPCCSAVQMANQTANYDEVSGQWCTETGLPPSTGDMTEAIVV